MTLADLKKGESMVVQDITCTGTGKQRFIDMGIVKGVQLKVKRFAPLGDPMIVEIHMFEVAIRKSDARYIIGE